MAFWRHDLPDINARRQEIREKYNELVLRRKFEEWKIVFESNRRLEKMGREAEEFYRNAMRRKMVYALIRLKNNRK